MSVKYVYGDLLESGCEYICHQVNCQGVMGSGIAGAIRRKWPQIFNHYIFWNKSFERIDVNHVARYDEMLGEILIVDVGNDTKVINMAAQYGYGADEKRYTSYDAFWNCLHQIKCEVPRNSIIGFPYQIGCGLGGANWTIIRTMIEEVLGKDYSVVIYQLEPKVKSPHCIYNNSERDWDFCK